jgi:hypothetical protein
MDVHVHRWVLIDQGRRDDVDPLVVAQVPDEGVPAGTQEQQSALLRGDSAGR